METIITTEQIRLQLSDSSRALADLTASMAYEKPAIIKQLIEVSLQDVYPWSPRASRVVNICCCRFPELFKPYASNIIKSLPNLRNEGVIRNFLSLLAETNFKTSKREKALLINLCFDYLLGSYPVAIKVFSMELIFQLSIDLPEIGQELCCVLEDQLPDASPGYKSRAQKILKKLKAY